MASQNPADNPGAVDAQTLPDRSQGPADNDAPPGEVSKNAAKKAAKMAKQAADKSVKSVNKGIGKAEAKKPTSKAQNKKSDGPALIGIDVTKEEDFPNWYQQVLTKGDMLDYYNVSGCFVLKVECEISTTTAFCLILTDLLHSLRRTPFGRKSNNGLTRISRRLASRTARSRFLFPKMC